ncbi:glycosyltransferase [Steroidobacter sp. S1-65]|uniref:Glycosyltransferase n=1 Tax=Steroidobacter gossypii TaxID=2805490 RepID=A0ABS1X3Y2_9GAMM|nr:glycosyltransferase [Steroidobacter gossypii]MBM0107930.1 glycosyltransferase [Steroidobacter gossypii]
MNGVGLTRDIKLLSDCLRQDGHEVSVQAIDAAAAGRRRSRLHQLGLQLKLAGSRAAADVDLNIMLEHVWAEFLPRARRNAVVPNPEWFDRNDVRFLRHVDHVWAKTRHAVDIFQRLGRHTLFLSFDSEDRYRPEVPRERRFFHLAGKSTMKGTDRLLRLWAQRPDWPTLTVIEHCRDVHAPEIEAANIERREGYLSEDELLEQQNACMFHVCPSLSEGWGHYIVEALSVGAVVLTVAAPPMDELVAEDRGLLAPYEQVGEQRLASTYYFSTAGLQAAIDRALAMSDQEWSRLSSNARRWFENNRCDFPLRVRSALRESVQ